MRDILFRGKRKDNGEWVEGFYSQFHNRPTINEPNSHQIFELIDEGIKLFGTSIGGFWRIVDPETVGQYTGLKDKNGKKIFEGDYWVDTDENDVFVVEFRDGQFCFVTYGVRGALMEYGWDEIAGGFGECDCEPMTDYIIENIEINGNIHDNPELLKGGVEE